MVIHDHSLDRTTGLKGLVAALTGADVDEIDAGSWFSPDFADQRIPRLAAVVDLANELSLNMNLEIKDKKLSRRHRAALVRGIRTTVAELNPDRDTVNFELLPQDSCGIPLAGAIRSDAGFT